MDLVTQSIPQYEPIDLVIRGSSTQENPFYAKLDGVFHGSDNQVITVPGFYDGDNCWKVRFSPTRVGTWRYILSSPDIQLEIDRGQLECIANPNPNVHGGLKIHPETPHHFQYEDGTDYFLMAYECNWLWALQLADHSGNRLREFVSSIKNVGFNPYLPEVPFLNTESVGRGLLAIFCCFCYYSLEKKNICAILYVRGDSE